MSTIETLRRQLEDAVAEARRVGDSPLRADRLADRIVQIVSDLPTAEVPDDVRKRIQSALSDAERVLRRDDDGHEAARHLTTALRASEQRPSKPSPFLD